MYKPYITVHNYSDKQSSVAYVFVDSISAIIESDNHSNIILHHGYIEADEDVNTIMKMVSQSDAVTDTLKKALGSGFADCF